MLKLTLPQMAKMAALFASEDLTSQEAIRQATERLIAILIFHGYTQENVLTAEFTTTQWFNLGDEFDSKMAYLVTLSNV